MWEISYDEAKNEYKGTDIIKLDTKNFSDLALAGNRMVVMGKKELHVFTLNKDMDLEEAFEDAESQYYLEE